VLQRLFELEARLPAWLRPTYRGACFIFGMGFGWAGKLFVLIILATLMLLAGAGPGLALFFGLLGVAVVAGGAGGTIRGILQPWERWGPIASWLRWTLATFGYVAVFGLLVPDGPFSRPDPTFYAIAAGICALAAGCLVLLDDRRHGRLSPRKFRLLQGRERMWAAANRVRARLLSRPAQ
jgi:O-antigen/teichoic acid export membrane protein